MTAVPENNMALVALGGNLATQTDNPNATLRAACAELSTALDVVIEASRFFQTPCFPPGAGPDFVNAAVRFETTLAAADLLAVLHRIEVDLGRERRARWGPRVVDLDLLALGAQVLPDPATFRHWADLAPERQRDTAPDQLIVPHPRLHERAFVLVPLADVAPGWKHPVLGLSVRQMLERLPAEAFDGIAPL